MASSNSPFIDLRDTAGGRIAYVKGTRLAVFWLVNALRRLGGDMKKAATLWDLSTDRLQAAVDYAEAFPEEMKAMQEQADANRALLEKAEAAPRKDGGRAKGKS